MRSGGFHHESVRRILLVIDDFNELVGMESLFRRLGFDVLSLGRESSVPEAILGFPADLTVATGRGRHVDGLKLAPKLRHGTTRSKLVVLVAAGSLSSSKAPDVDAVIDTPFDPIVALKTVCGLLALDAAPIIEKYEKIVSARLFSPQELKIIKHPPPMSDGITHVKSSNPALAGVVSGTSPANPLEMEIEYRRMPTARESRYAKFLDDKAEEDLPPMANLDSMREARKLLQKSESDASIEELQRAAKHTREKREFVRAMLEAGKGETPPEIDRSMTKKKSES